MSRTISTAITTEAAINRFRFTLGSVYAGRNVIQRLHLKGPLNRTLFIKAITKEAESMVADSTFIFPGYHRKIIHAKIPRTISQNIHALRRKAIAHSLGFP